MNEFSKANAEFKSLNARWSSATIPAKITLFILTPVLAVAMVIAFIYGAFSAIDSSDE